MEYSDLIKLEECKLEANGMLGDLECHHLDVYLSEPIDETGRCLRLVRDQNPDWYKAMFGLHSNMSKGKDSRTNIRRHRVIKRLKKIIDGVYKNTFVYNTLMEEIHIRLFEGFYCGEFNLWVPPQLFEEEDELRN